MDIIPQKTFNCLRQPTASTVEPVSEEITVYNLCRMISKRTHFRIMDIEEVVREVGYVAYALLLQRKSVKLGGIVLRSKWHRLDAPRYVRDFVNSDSGYWVFGYYIPEVDFGLQERHMYTSRDGEYSEKFIYNVSSYLPETVTDEASMKSFANDCLKETSILGKNMCVNEEGYFIYPENSRKRKKRRFDENFHPTWYEYRRYYFARFCSLRDWHERKRNGEPDLSYSYVNERMFFYGYDPWNRCIIAKSGENDESKQDRNRV